MTPTLMGRWQTRIFLNIVFGIPAILFWMAVFDQLSKSPATLEFWHTPYLLLYMTGIGMVLDVLYITLQKLRWDRDWPPAFQLVVGLAEGGLVLALSLNDLLPNVTHCDDDLTQFPIAYLSMFLPAYLFLFGPMKVVFPRWRFSGGQLLGGSLRLRRATLCPWPSPTNPSAIVSS